VPLYGPIGYIIMAFAAYLIYLDLNTIIKEIIKEMKLLIQHKINLIL